LTARILRLAPEFLFHLRRGLQAQRHFLLLADADVLRLISHGIIDTLAKVGKQRHAHQDQCD
jgi:hypothetical protein